MKKIKKILSNINKVIKTNEFKNKYRMRETDFIRNRKLPFYGIILYILSNTKKGCSIEIDSFIEQFSSNPLLTISKQALSQARQKISYKAFIDLFRKSIREYFQSKHLKKFNGYLLVSIDSTTLQVPDNAENREYFGYSTSTNNHKTALARASLLYDVLNDVVIDGVVNHYKSSDRDAFFQLYSPFSKHKKHRSIVLLDRGYPSKNVIAFFESTRNKFLMRASTSFIKVVNEANTSDSVVSYKYRGKIIKLRVIKVPLNTGEVEVLITNIFNKELKDEDFRTIYNLRWGIETKYREIKHQYVVEKFTGIKPNSVLQDFYATLLLSNLTSLLKKISDNKITESIEKKRLLHSYQTNRNSLIGLFKKKFLSMMLRPKLMAQQLHRIIFKVIKMRSIVRPNRTRERKKIHTKLNYQLNNKPIF